MNDLEKTGVYQPDSPESPTGPTATPQHIGRYRVEKILGQGGFGVVYLAHDGQLRRLVAIKVPHRKLVDRPEDVEAYLTEARTVANLDHAHIVPVYDVGSTEDCPCFIVSKFIEGSTLAQKNKEDRPTFGETAELIATVAEALHYAHKRGLVHRDIKPGNILIDTTGEPFVVDFGLALKEENVGHGPRYAGTPAYMSPEQARGEGHRVDGRSDIFSLGVVFYELLVGRRPFRADSQSELLEQVTSFEPRPPRQYDDSIPKELERICLKALSKRASERYTTAMDMADDLRHFLAEQPSPLTASIGSPSITPVVQPPSTLGASGTAVTPTTPTSDHQLIKIVPKGLRSFDAHDSDFFLELLPGPRDRDGLPDSIRFWKSRIEENDADSTFSVGLIYGPSGCGKSSLVKAGLLPRLSDDVIAVYVESTADETETRLLNSLRKRCPALSEGLSLKETLAALRRGQAIPAGKKVVIVLDQLEQWLHAKSDEQNTELVQALRQCDGSRVQCVVMVRDDFWLAVSRFLRELEVRLVEGQNSALVDLFPLRHAEKVLAAFGRAFGVLPENPNETSKDQKQFLEQAVAGLAQEGKVVCVRLALFAEMMKGKAWTPTTFKEVGGTEGVGVTFLEETFSATTAPPVHRYHQQAARAVLKALLPETGSDIKGHMRSYAELLEASGYGNHPNDIDDLIRILDSEIRLITPTDPGGKAADNESVSQTGQKYFQLTHDYLVHSLREWLTRKQKETQRGRAELLLADRAAVWNSRPENRQLPSLLQSLHIRWWTQKKHWTEPQKAMMAKAEWVHAIQAAYYVLPSLVFCTFIVGFMMTVAQQQKANRADFLVSRLFETNTSQVLTIIREITPDLRRWTDPLLQKNLLLGGTRGLHSSLALLPVDDGQLEYLYERLLKAEPLEMVVIREALFDHKQDLTERLWTLLENPKSDQQQRFRAACALSDFAPDDPRWEKVSGDVAAMLVVQKPFEITHWTEAMTGVGHQLIPPLADFLVDEKRNLSERGLTASIYGKYAAKIPEAYSRLEKRLTEKAWPIAPVESKVILAKHQASIGVALFVMGQYEKVWPLLRHSPDPTLRSFLIERFQPMGVDPKVLMARLEEEQEVSVKRAILLSLGEYGPDHLSIDLRLKLLPQLLQFYRDAPDPGIHGAAEWLLRQWQASDEMKAIDKELATGKVEGQRQWYLNQQGQTMVVVPKPGDFWVGERDPWMGERVERHQSRIDRNFAIASKEVTVEQFIRFIKVYQYDKEYSPTGDCPINSASWYDAAAYCNWLSEQEGIPKDQWCYEPNKDGKYEAGMTMAADFLQRAGYRLPTEAEWEYACRAGGDTGFSFGDSEEMLGKYCWFVSNSLSKSHPVGSLRANDLGLFDMHGNMFEWCQDSYEVKADQAENAPVENEGGRVLRGGSFYNLSSNVRSASRLNNLPTVRSDDVGFRLARTLPPTPLTSLPPTP